MLSQNHCDLFNQPFFQFAQLKQYAPETIPQLKAKYKSAWTDWKISVLQVYDLLKQSNPQFAPPHIERWCNGWQVRAHFFAYFKYTTHSQDAAIISLLLNRKRLMVSLNWHSYKASISTISLHQYNQWFENLDNAHYADFNVWHGHENEYANYPTLNQYPHLQIQSVNDFFCIGKQLSREELAKYDCINWITNIIGELVPLYEKCFQAA